MPKHIPMCLKWFWQKNCHKKVGQVEPLLFEACSNNKMHIGHKAFIVSYEKNYSNRPAFL